MIIGLYKVRIDLYGYKMSKKYMHRGREGRINKLIKKQNTKLWEKH